MRIMRTTMAIFAAAMAAASPVSLLAQDRLEDHAPPWEELDSPAPIHAVRTGAAFRCAAGERPSAACRRSARSGHRDSASFQIRQRRFR